MNDRVWIKEDNGSIYYCEIKAVHRDDHYQLIEYEVFPIIGCFKGFTTLLRGDLTSPTVCIIWIDPDRPFGKACYDLDILMKDGK